MTAKAGALRIGFVSVTAPSSCCAFLRRRLAIIMRCCCSAARLVMTRTLIAISLMTAGALMTLFVVTAAAAYQFNEHCSEKAAWDGNC
jgi:hypothetical protein